MFIKKKLYNFIDPIIGAAAITAGSNILGGLLGGKGKSKNRQEPAEQNPNYAKAYADWISSLYGGFDAEYYLTQKDKTGSPSIKTLLITITRKLRQRQAIQPGMARERSLLV